MIDSSMYSMKLFLEKGTEEELISLSISQLTML